MALGTPGFSNIDGGGGGGGGAGVPLNFSQTKGAQVTITAAEAKPATVVSVTITTAGNPVQIIVSGDANPSGAGTWGLLNIYRDAVAIGQNVQFESSAANENVPYCLQVVDEPAAGTWTYSLKVVSVTTNTQFGESAGPIITVTELGGVGTAVPSGAAGGDLGGTYPNPDVVAIQGYSVSTTAPGAGEALVWDGSNWVPTAVSAGAGGNNTNIQYNSGSSLAGTNNFIFDDTLTRVTLTDGSQALDVYPNLIEYVGAGSLQIEASTTVDVGTLTATGVNLGSATAATTIAGAFTLPTADGASGEVLTTDGAGNVTWQAGGGGSGAAGGANEIQYNDGSNALTASSGLTFDGTTLAVNSIGPSAFTVSSTIDGQFLDVNTSLYQLTLLDPTQLPLNVNATLGPSDLAIYDDNVSQSGNVQAGLVGVFDNATTNNLKMIVPAGVATIKSEDALSAAQDLNLSIRALQVNTDPGTSGYVLTSNGAGVAPTWQVSGAGLGSKVLLCVEGGSYATLQAAVDAAGAEDVILVGPKATGDWGNVTLNVVNKPLTIAAVSGPGPNKIVAVGSITYDLGSAGPALNVNLNEVYLYGLYIQGSFAGGSAVTLTGGASYPGRLRCYGCYILNTSATGAAAVTNSNQGANSSIYLDSCVVSLSNSAAGSAIVQTAGYTVIRNRCDVGGSLAVGATGNAINVSAGTMEIYDSYISVSRAVPTINITGATTFVSVGYSTVLNSSNSAGACCAYIGTSGATFGAGDATLAAGSTLPTSAVAVSGVAGGSFLYANVSFSYVSTVSTVTATATLQSGGLFSYGMSVGSALATTFVVSSTGNITKLNNVTTSFPSAQGSANQVLTNNGSGTLTWANGNLRTLGSVGATPTAANLRTNVTYTVNVAAVALPAMAAGDDGLTISLVNISGANSTVTPSTGVARTMSTGGGQTWVWRNTGTTWYCISNV